MTIKYPQVHAMLVIALKNRVKDKAKIFPQETLPRREDR